MKQERCEYCDRVVEPVVLRVPAQICPRCGERYYAAAAVREMDRLMQQPDHYASFVAVPVIELNSAT